MADQSLTIMEGDQPINVSFKDDKIYLSVVKEILKSPSDGGAIHLAIKEERLDVSSPLVLAVPGWPFGPNPNRITELQKDVDTVVDEVVMPSYYRVVKWLFLISDEFNNVSVTSEIKAMRRGNDVYYIEYGIIGDSGMIPYEIDVVVENEKIQLIITSSYDGGELTIRTSKIGIFN